MMYTNNAGISYYKRGKRFFKNSGWLEREITKDEYDDAIREIKKEEQKMKKQIFSVRKFIEAEEPQVGAERVIESLKLWALECDGLTPEEMNQKGFRCNDSWLIEEEE